MDLALIIAQSTGDPEDLKAGEAIVFSRQDGSKGLIFRCPQCNAVTAASSHKYNPDTQSVTPSLVHDPKLGGCGWHGYITNGRFRNA